MNVQGVKCQKYDTDGDGYISCSISVKEINGNIKMVPLECAGPFSFNDGCRSPKPSVDYF